MGFFTACFLQKKIVLQVLQFLDSSLCKIKSDKRDPIQQQVFLEELMNELISSKLQHLVNSTANVKLYFTDWIQF